MKAKHTQKSNILTRREFLKNSIATGIGAAFAAPIIMPSSVFGANPPSERITVGCIGVGRMGSGDMREALGFGQTQVIAVCDADSKRANNARQTVEKRYASRTSSGTYKGCVAYQDFRELIARDDIDAILISTPDHWHVPMALAAAKAGKDIFMQKPLSLTIEEGRVLSDTVRRYGNVFLIGSQQRSDQRFRQACELVRNGRIGELKTVNVTFGLDPGTTPQPPMPVPENLDYDLWLGPAPWAPYTETRVHPQNSYDRPGWLRIQDYGAGMITGWGSHHLDIAQWAMGTEYTGPTEVEGKTEYPKDGLWDVHGMFRVEYIYPSGVKIICEGNEQNREGVRFEGTEGWINVNRGRIDAEPKTVLTSSIKPDEINLPKSNNHKANFFECIKSRAETIAPVEVAHRSCTMCLVGDISMQLGQKLKWDPKLERFVDNEEANRMLFRPMR
ncbi:MAG: oxidoreductase, partial [Planctomycetes bacterium RBG_13_44_8b]